MTHTKPLIVAHRGASAVAPENTLEAFRTAIDGGAEGIEFDVRLGADGVPVVFHDETLDRIAGRHQLISSFTSDELKNVDAGSWFNRAFPERARIEFTSERIPTMAETLDLLSGFQGRIYIELKFDEGERNRLAESVTELLKNSPLLPNIVVKSFKLSTIPHVKRLLPGVSTAALFEPSIMNMLRKKKYIVDIAKEFGADELSLHYSLATKLLMKKAETENLPVTVWTVDRPRWIKKAKKLGLFAIITNNPSRMLALKNEINSSASQMSRR